MSGTLLQILGILAVIVLVAMVLLRPAGMIVAVLAVGVVVAAVIVNWHDVEQYRHQRSLVESSQQAIASATIAAAAANAPHPGS
jgi:hypothetical protein